MPLVATPASVSRQVCTTRPSNGLVTCTCRARAADSEVAGAVDGEARAAGERLGERVGEQALREAAGVEPQAGRAVDGEGVEVDDDRIGVWA